MYIYTGIFSVTSVDSQLAPSAVLNHATKVISEVELELVSYKRHFPLYHVDDHDDHWMMESCH